MQTNFEPFVNILQSSWNLSALTENLKEDESEE
jgi:hypothetical protein